jgi:hypothetical protein
VNLSDDKPDVRLAPVKGIGTGTQIIHVTVGRIVLVRIGQYALLSTGVDTF